MNEPIEIASLTDYINEINTITNPEKIISIEDREMQRGR